MKIVGSVIARLGSKRLTYKNLLPYQGEPLVLRAVRKLLKNENVDLVVLSTDSELIARTRRIIWRLIRKWRHFVEHFFPVSFVEKNFHGVLTGLI